MKKKAATGKENMVIRQVRTLLTDVEIGARRRDLETSQEAKEVLETKLEPELQNLASLKAKVRNLSYAIATGYEFREMELRFQLNEKRRVVEYVDPATGEIIETRTMTDDDLQGEML